MGWSGEPTTSELKNPERNISMAAYLNILERPLAGIEDSKVSAICAGGVDTLTGQVRCYGLSRQIWKKAISKSTIWTLMSFLDHVAEIILRRRLRAISRNSRHWTRCKSVAHFVRFFLGFSLERENNPL